MILLIMLGLIVGTFVLCALPYVRCVIFHPISVTVNGVRDLYFYFKYKKWNDAEKTVGEIACFEGLFGEGKTLDLVHFISRLYNLYNNKLVYKDGVWKTQRVVVLSNIVFNHIPYINFTNLQQLVNLVDEIAKYDEEHDSYTIVYCAFDEMQNCMNSRNFKSNFSSGSDIMRILTQLRKVKCSVWYTSTRFNQTDAFIRQDTMFVYRVHKVWRLQGYKKFDAWDMENCTGNVAMLKPLSANCWFVRNRDYSAYDTHALSNQISHDVLNGDMLPELERNLQLASGDDYTPLHPSKKWKKLHQV